VGAGKLEAAVEEMNAIWPRCRGATLGDRLGVRGLDKEIPELTEHLADVESEIIILAAPLLRHEPHVLTSAWSRKVGTGFRSDHPTNIRG